MWNEISSGRASYLAGTSGTATVPANACVVGVMAHASGAGASVTILGGASIPIVANAPPLYIPIQHLLFAATSAASRDVVFTGTDSYAVFYIVLGGAS
jgi:hypothetical protein